MTVIKPFSRRRFATAMSECGRPNSIPETYAVYRSMIKAGASHGVAWCLAIVASNVAGGTGYEWKIMDAARALRSSMRYAHRDAYPNGQWARLFDHHGPAAVYLDEQHPDIRMWCTLPQSRRAAVAGDLGVPS
jgi:hypothetical protein